jgi:hypothetical protein
MLGKHYMTELHPEHSRFLNGNISIKSGQEGLTSVLLKKKKKPKKQ